MGGDDMISTNAATAIRRFADALNAPGVQANQAVPDAAQRWATALELGEMPNGLHLVVADHVHRTVFPLFGRAQLQMGYGATPRSTEVLESTKGAFFKTLSSIQPAERTLLATVNDPSIGQLLMIEETIANTWAPIPIALLDETVIHIEDCRELLNELVANDAIGGLIHYPLLDALDWALRSVRASKNLGVLVGLGPALTAVRSNAIFITQVASGGFTDGSHAESWTRLRSVFGVLSAAEIVLSVAGFSTPVLVVPAIANGVMHAFDAVGAKETVLRATQRLVDSCSPPALSAPIQSDADLAPIGSADDDERQSDAEPDD